MRQIEPVNARLLKVGLEVFPVYGDERSGWSMEWAVVSRTWVLNSRIPRASGLGTSITGYSWSTHHFLDNR